MELFKILVATDFLVHQISYKSHYIPSKRRSGISSMIKAFGFQGGIVTIHIFFMEIFSTKILPVTKKHFDIVKSQCPLLQQISSCKGKPLLWS